MPNTSALYLAMLRMVPRYPKAIATTELVSRLGEQGFSKDAMMQRSIMSGAND